MPRNGWNCEAAWLTLSVDPAHRVILVFPLPTHGAEEPHPSFIRSRTNDARLLFLEGSSNTPGRRLALGCGSAPDLQNDGNSQTPPPVDLVAQDWFALLVATPSAVLVPLTRPVCDEI